MTWQVLVGLITSGAIGGVGWWAILSSTGRSGRDDPHGVAAAGAAVLAIVGTVIFIAILAYAYTTAPLTATTPSQSTAELACELGRPS